MKTKKYRIPRKLKKKIPKGLYCYTPMRFDLKTGIYHVKPCPFYRSGPEDSVWGMCKLIKDEVMDQCKSCGMNYGFK